MSVSSDSETFESADEIDDFADIKNIPSPAKTTQTKKLNVDEKNSLTTTSTTHPNNEKDIKLNEKNVNVNNNNVESNEIEKSLTEKIKSTDIKDNETSADPLDLDTPANVQQKKLNETSLNCDKDNNQSDGWDVDDWGDIDDNTIEESSTNNQKIKSDHKSNTTASKAQTGDDGEGWNFDDWDLLSSSASTKTTAKSQSNSNPSYISLLDKLSSGSTNSKHHQITSNYDTFPVLNKLGKKEIQSNIDDDKNNEIINQTVNKEIIQESDDRVDSGASGWGVWKPWGNVVSLLSTASSGVASLTSQVTQVIESGIGVPDPEEMVRIQQQQDKELETCSTKTTSDDVQQTIKKDDNNKSLMLENFVYNFQNIGNKVLTGGLDTLEGIGKKTMTILKENDRGLLNKRYRAFIKNDDIVLSQVLREAKEKSEINEKHLKQIKKQMYKKQLNFETLFDDYHGLVHLEALEMLSDQSAMKLESLLGQLSGVALHELHETLDEVKELCELPEQTESDDVDGLYDVNELNVKLLQSIEDLCIPVDFKDILDCWSENGVWLNNHNVCQIDNDSDNDDGITSQIIYDKALRCLAQTSALAVNKMHKLAELLIIKDHHSTANEADSLVQLTSVFCWHLNGIGTRFGNILCTIEKKDDETNSFITSIFVEGLNSISYIQKAFQLFIPILQLGAA